MPDVPEPILYNLGCKVNRYEGECLLRYFEEKKKRVVIVNTCVVTRTAQQKSKRLIRRIQRLHPDREIIATGCLEFYQIPPGVTWLTMAEKESISECYLPLTQRSRYYLKIEDGCDRGCHYCVVARIRGRPRSKPIERIVQEISYAKEVGFAEVVLVGVNLGRYRGGLPFLLSQLGKLPDLPRIRFSSLEPDAITWDLIERIRDLPIAPHIHLSLQHTEARVLESMGREVVALDRIFSLITKIPEVNIGADLIVGYPTEGKREFETLVRRVEELPLVYLHVFPFSPRPKTPAAQLPDSVPMSIKRERVAILRSLSRKKRDSYWRRFLGRTLPAVVEPHNGTYYGLTGNYLRIRLSEPIGARSVLVRIDRLEGDELIGSCRCVTS